MTQPSATTTPAPSSLRPEPVPSSSSASRGPNSATVGLLATLVAKPGKEAEVAELLQAGQQLVEQEAQTLIWFSFRISEDTFGIYDAFADEAGRAAHLEGRLAAALMGRADELLAVAPRIEPVQILGRKYVAGTNVAIGTPVGLSVRLHAKPEQRDELERLLVAGQAMVEAESQTPVWFAFRISADEFGIYDVFPSDAGRTAHVEGELAAALLGRADELLAEPPSIAPVDVLAGMRRE
ncbi:MAG: hypothetical protein AAF799_47725 [Myxococcota bacterium]